jgi:hypothetical protein
VAYELESRLLPETVRLPGSETLRRDGEGR